MAGNLNMKEEILHKLKQAEKKLKKAITLTERNEPIETIIKKTSEVRRMLSSIKDMILRNHLSKIAYESKLSEKEVHNLYDFM